MARATIDVDPSLVTWAREAAGLTPQAAAKKIGVSPTKLAKWETPGASERPTPRQLEKLADAVKRPVATFFLPAPPVEPPLPADFRRPPTAEGTQPLSPATRLAVRRARRLQQVYTELVGTAEQRIAPPPRLTRAMAPERAAQDARGYLGVTTAEQAQWQDSAGALRQWRGRFERLGYLVFQFAMPADEISGFSLNSTPAVVLNKKDPPSRRCFTLPSYLIDNRAAPPEKAGPQATGRSSPHTRREPEVSRSAGIAGTAPYSRFFGEFSSYRSLLDLDGSSSRATGGLAHAYVADRGVLVAVSSFDAGDDCTNSI